MSKRERQAEEDERPQKRSRQEYQPPQAEEIHFARQLQDVLIFRQDGIQQLRNGIASFKAFLESILYHKEEDNRARQISILREYLETQKPADETDLERPFLSQLWQAWSFANQNNNDHLASSISAILALLLKTLSGILDLRQHGILLCRTVLHHQHLRLVKRCLDAPKHKDFVISPSIRLLTEVTGFDGGVVARQVYKHREQTFDVSTIRRCLGLFKTEISEEEAKRKPAIRTLTLRYVLSLLKYLHEGGKGDVLKNRPICHAIFSNIHYDPSEIVLELLNTTEQSILKDSELPRSAKAALLSSQNLERVTEIATSGDEEHPTAQGAFSWLKAVCSTPDYGILRQSGWYPPGTAKADELSKRQAINLGLDSIEFYDRSDSPNVRNPVLLAWAQTLRAHSNERERELLLTCFNSAPELVAAYFFEKTMSMDPKLSNTWIGYASLLFEVVNLPIPAHLAGDDEMPSLPPQTSLIIESILPRPISQTVLTRCLNHTSDLVTFFAIRIMVLAFQKLNAILDRLRAPPSSSKSELWAEASERLLQRFTERVPPIKDVIALFRKMPDDTEHALQREAVTRLLRLYHEVTPLQASEEPFDISISLTAALIRQEQASGDVEQEIRGLWSFQLEHLLVVAQSSIGMKWFTKQGGLIYSPTTTLLRLHRKDVTNRQVRTLLEHVLTEHGILNQANPSADEAPLSALIASSLQLDDDSKAWDLVDDCIARGSRKPVKYVDDLEEITAGCKENDDDLANPSVIAAVLLEQAPFAAAATGNESAEKTAWIDRFLSMLKKTSDEGPVLRRLTKDVSKVPGWQSSKVKSADVAKAMQQVKLPGLGAAEQETTLAATATATGQAGVPQLPYLSPPTEPTSNPALTRWSQKDIDLAVEDGDIDALLLCLCSGQDDIRRQGWTQLKKLHNDLRSASSTENSQQMSLLIGEVIETFEQQYLDNGLAFPYVAGTFAVRALRVQTQPQHFIYPKLNRFLIRGPEWRVSKLPGYWLSNTVLSLPEDDDAYWREVTWILEWLVDGLRTAEDLNILRRGDVFEKAMALWHSPGAASHKAVRDRVFELLFRVTCIEGGSNTLITRTGVLSWLLLISNEGSAGLKRRILDTCDTDRIQAWSGGELKA